MKDVSFTVNQYDEEGSNFNDGIFIYIDENTIIRFINTDELYKFAQDIESIAAEIDDMHDE